MAAASIGAFDTLWGLIEEEGTMKVFINFLKGFQTSRKNFKMVLFLFILNLLFALVLALPMFTAIEESIGQSEVADRMKKGFDYMWWEEFRDQSQGIESTFSPSIVGKGAVLDNFVHLINIGETPLPRAILILSILYVLLHTFLSGGIINILNKDIPGFSIRDFFTGAGKFATRFFLLMLISWAFFFLVIALRNSLFSLVNTVSETARSEVLPFYINLASSVLTYILFLFFQMIFDYARIKIVIEDSSSILRTTKDAFLFVFKNMGATMGLFYLLLVANLALTVVYILFKEIIPQTSTGTIVIIFLIQQMFICSIIWIRCWLYSSQSELYKYLK